MTKEQTPQDINDALVVPSLSTAGICVVVGKKYIVTRASDDGTFEVGDHVSINPDGSISCREAHGWIDACDVAEAAAGIAVEIDKEWVERQKARLYKKLAELDT